MPDLNWPVFEALPGAAWRNFELLCHALVQRNLGRFGQLVSVRVQPVVEFHLKLTSSCWLGDTGQRFGWQCKWWAPTDRLNRTRKDVILKAFERQPEYIPDLTDWVLWTRRPLSANDWKWIQEQETELQLHTWHEDNINDLFVDDAEVLRSVYFGESIYTPERAKAAFEESAATLQDRYLPQLHVAAAEEGALRQTLGDVDYWSRVTELARRTRTAIEAVGGLDPVSDEITDYEVIVSDFGSRADAIASIAEEAVAALDDRGPMHAAELASLALREDLDEPSIEGLIQTLHAHGNHQEHVRAASTMRDFALRLREQLEIFVQALGHPLVVVAGTAGQGKTHLSASLASGGESGPIGALVPARAFRAPDIDLDRLASLAGFQSVPVDLFLDALNALGVRACRRIPLVIDGLNESAAPAEWASALARLRVKVARLSHVVVVVTVRPSYARQCVPSETPGLRLRGFSVDWRRACRLYFMYFRIEANLDDLPQELFSDPLYLRVFCEATNDPGADEVVQLGYVPSGWVPVFQAFVSKKLERIQERLRYDIPAVRLALSKVAERLWETTSRTLPFSEMKEVVGDGPLELDRSLAHAFVDENLFDRDVMEGEEVAGPVFDALGGYLIAEAIVGTCLVNQQLNAETEARLVGDATHPLAEDIRISLGDLVKRTHGVPLRAVSRNELARLATTDLINVDASLLDADDVEALTQRVAEGAMGAPLWDTVFRNRALVDHPLNAAWLHEALGRMAVADRDLDWSEWVREDAERLTDAIETASTRWRELGAGTDVDVLDATWMQWVLTVTDRELRDRATRALYWLGRSRPDLLHELAVGSLTLNDPYVTERLFGAAYGVAMANQFATQPWLEAASPFLRAIEHDFVNGDPGRVKDHWLLREYIIGISQLVERLHPGHTPAWTARTQDALPLASGAPDLIERTDERASEMDGIFRMDFENYTLGRLTPRRRNYNMDHPPHVELVAEVKGRAWDLGWREGRFGGSDRAIGQSSYGRDHRGDKIERYGKKYSWIAFWEAAGRRAAAGALRDGESRLSDVDLDVSFPEEPSPAPLSLRSWVRSRHRSEEAWVRRGTVELPDSMLVIQQHDRTWICVDGYLVQRDTEVKRTVFVFFWGLFVPAGEWDGFAAVVRRRGAAREVFPEGSEDYYTFAGEIPWADAFAESLEIYESTQADRRDYPPDGERLFRVENPAHHYEWESYHSVLNQAGGASVPSKAIGRVLGLRGRPQTFDLFAPDGSRASMSFRAPADFESGRLLYLRSDLLRDYERETKQEFGWVLWGERELQFEQRDEIPAWYPPVRRAGADRIQRVAALGELLPE